MDELLLLKRICAALPERDPVWNWCLLNDELAKLPSLSREPALRARLKPTVTDETVALMLAAVNEHIHARSRLVGH